MSTGTRLDHAPAMAIAAEISKRWQFARVAHEVGPVSIVGSLRRMRPTVGDIEFLAPHSVKDNDLVYQLIEPTLVMPGRGDALFGPPADAIGKPTKGFKPYFLQADFELVVGGVTVAAQVFRYQKSNRGWQTVLRTGPQEFGIWFLQQWKKRHDIHGEASKEGHLVDRYGMVIPTESEEDAFRLCGLQYVHPQQREAWRKS